MPSARGGRRLVGRELLKHAGGRIIRGKVRKYSAALDQFVAHFDDDASEILSWDELEDYMPVLPFVQQARAKLRARAAPGKKTRRAETPPTTEEATNGTADGEESVIVQANRLVVKMLRGVLVALVGGNRSVHPDDKRGIQRCLQDRSISVRALAFGDTMGLVS